MYTNFHPLLYHIYYTSSHIASSHTCLAQLFSCYITAKWQVVAMAYNGESDISMSLTTKNTLTSKELN